MVQVEVRCFNYLTLNICHNLLHDLQRYEISFEVPFVSSDLLSSILRYVWLITNT